MTHARQILPGESHAAIEQASQVLQAGGLVGMPTETVYGLAAHALDMNAVAKIFKAKERPTFDPLIVHVPGAADAERYAHMDETAGRLAEAFWPGPLTLVLPRRHDSTTGTPVVPDLVTAGLDTVALRVPVHPVAQSLLARSGLPLAAPSANRFGSISPTTAQHVHDELGDRVELILDGGACERGVESTVLRVVDERVEVLRLGAVAVESIEKVIGHPLTVVAPSSSPGLNARNKALPSPGLTDRHYAPRTPMRLVESLDDLRYIELTGPHALIGIGALPADHPRFMTVRSLSEAGDLAQAAARLFAMLRELDGLGLDGIVAVAVDEVGIGKAINDRLRRGSAR